MVIELKSREIAVLLSEYVRDMNMSSDKRTFVRLWVVSLVVTGMVLPYVLALNPALVQLFTPVVYAVQIAQSAVLFALAIFFGLKLAKKTGFELAVLEGTKPLRHLKPLLGISVGLGVLAGVLILVASPLFSSSDMFLQAEAGVALWKRFFASFYGGFGEEILFRLFMLSLCVWVVGKITRAQAEKPAAWIVWTAIGVSTVLFGLGHLGITGSMTLITPMVVARAIVLNGIGGVIFGWLYWKKGLESAMIAHFSADIVLHVLAPIVVGLFAR